MIDEDLLRTVALAIGLLALLANLLWLGRAGVAVARQRWVAQRRDRALAELAKALAGEGDLPAVAALRALPRDERIDVLIEMAFTVGGRQREHLDDLSRAAGIRYRALAWAGARRWTRRLRGARLLAFFGDGSEFAGEALLTDRNPDVRAQAAEWAGRHTTQQRLEQLVAMLGDKSPRCRFAAGEALSAMRQEAIEPVLGVLREGAGGPVNSHLLLGGLRVGRAIAVPRFLEPALVLTRSWDGEVRTEAAHLVAAVGGSDAAARLEAMLEDPDPDVRAAAAAGLGDLGHWQAAASVARLLVDRSFRPRRAAADALTKMGPTGELLLRRIARRGLEEGAGVALRALSEPPDIALLEREAMAPGAGW